MEAYCPIVVRAVSGPGRTINAYFSDGRVTRYDVAPLIARGGVFSKLADKDFFRDALTVLNGTVAWDVSGYRDSTTCIDIDPITLYEAERVQDLFSGAVVAP